MWGSWSVSTAGPKKEPLKASYIRPRHRVTRKKARSRECIGEPRGVRSPPPSPGVAGVNSRGPSCHVETPSRTWPNGRSPSNVYIWLNLMAIGRWARSGLGSASHRLCGEGNGSKR